jgi:hypothetical protein
MQGDSLVWSNPDVLRALLGAEFTTGMMIALEASLGGDTRYPANLHRSLSKSPILTKASNRGAGQGTPGRQQTQWKIAAGG